MPYYKRRIRDVPSLLILPCFVMVLMGRNLRDAEVSRDFHVERIYFEFILNTERKFV